MDHKVENGSPNARVDARVLRSRAALRTGLIALLADVEFDDVTVAGIVARAGVGYATFFRHYADKEALLADVADGLIADLTRQMAPLVLSGDAITASSALVDRVEADRPLFHALLIGAGDAFRRTMTDRAIDMSLAWPAESGSGKLPRSLVVRYMVSATLTVLTWWLQETPAVSRNELETIICRLVIDPVGRGGT